MSAFLIFSGSAPGQGGPAAAIYMSCIYVFVISGVPINNLMIHIDRSKDRGIDLYVPFHSCMSISVCLFTVGSAPSQGGWP